MATEPAIVMPDLVVVDGDQKTEEEVKAKTEDQDVDIEVEKEEGVVKGEERDFVTENAELKKQLLELGSEVRDIKKAREAPKETPKAPTVSEEGLSHDQLVGLIKEHGDNPEVMARIITHIASEQAKNIAVGIRDETVKNVEYQNWHRELRTANDSTMIPVFESDPNVKQVVDDTVKRLALDQHPMGEVLVYSLIEHIKRQKGTQQEAANAERTEKLKKEQSLDKTRSGSDKGSKRIGLSKEQKEVADKLGVAYDTYAKFIPKE